MATPELFKPLSVEEIRAALARYGAEGLRTSFRDRVRLGVDYINNRQLDDVEKELRARYASQQVGSRGNQITPQAIPIAQRYIAEAATAYNRPVQRKLVVAETGAENEQTKRLTDALKRMLDDASYNETMHGIERLVILCRSAGLWYQARGGRLRPQIFSAADIHPIKPRDRTWFDESDQDDYRAFVVELGKVDATERQYAWSEASQVGWYAGDGVASLRGSVDLHPNPYRWPTVIDSDDGRGTRAELPLQMFTVWHREKQAENVLPEADVEIAQLNREINMQWSILLDTISHQGWSQNVHKTVNPGAAPPQMSMGTRFVTSIGVDEDMLMLSSPVNYTDLTAALGTFVRTMAIAMRQSPHDFSLEGQAALSGFAKLVDSLPKLEARQERITRLAASEARVAWPRLAVIGRQLGYFDVGIEQLAKLRLVTTFADVDIPLSTAEQVQREAHDIQHGITTPARILAARENLTLEEAIARMDEDRGETDEGAETEQGAPSQDEIQKTAMNGAQVTALVDTVARTAAGEIPPESARAIIQLGFQLSASEAASIVASAGSTFAPREKEQPVPPPQQPPQAEPPKRDNMLSSIIARTRRGNANAEP